MRILRVSGVTGDTLRTRARVFTPSNSFDPLRSCGTRRDHRKSNWNRGWGMRRDRGRRNDYAESTSASIVPAAVSRIKLSRLSSLRCARCDFNFSPSGKSFEQGSAAGTKNVIFALSNVRRRRVNRYDSISPWSAGCVRNNLRRAVVSVLYGKSCVHSEKT
jgi:hypothetical protein